MRVLLLGSGGRESALAWALQRSSGVTDLVAAPGNPGIARIASTLDVDLEEPAAVAALADHLDATLVVIGPEAPLTAGVANALRASGRAVFGPDAEAARIEASKEYAKQLMDRAAIPTARWSAFDNVVPATEFLDELGPPYVVKADGLAGGKGVVVTEDRAEAIEAVRDRLERGAFGEAGRRVVLEEFLDGEELSLIALTDGVNAVACPPARDYKRALDGDRGPNTGGMGAFSPVPACPPDLASDIVEAIIRPMIRASADAGHHFVGALYAGLALTSAGPKVVEFNARWGDPETQVLVPRLRSDLAEVFRACAEADLQRVSLDWSDEACVAVVLASEGYPGPHGTGHPIEGVDEAAGRDGVYVFHAGTTERDGTLFTHGGRVVTVSATGSSLPEARSRAYGAADMIRFEGRQMRSDVALGAQPSEEDA